MNVIHKTGALLTLAACAVIAAAAAVDAQDSPMRASIMSLADDVYPNARAIISIEDSGAEDKPSLGAASFTVTIDGAPVNVVSAELAGSEDAPLYLLFVIDTSGSMEGAPLASAKAAAKALIAELGVHDHIALLHFGDDVTLAQDFTADRGLINAALDGLVAQGNTALYQATAAGSVKIGTSGANRRAVVLLSDGADFGGRSIATREEAVAAAGSAGVPFFAIAQGVDLDRPYLQRIAEVTNGRYLEAPRPEDLNALYVSIGRLLRSQYVVTFNASSASASAASQVAITVTDGDQSAAAESVYRPGADFLPAISIEGLAAGDELNAPRDITVVVSSGAPKIRWYVDDVNVLEASAAPYVFRFDPGQFAAGAHTLKVAVGDGPSSIEQSVAFRSTPPAVSSGGGAPILPVAGVMGVLVLAGIAFLAVRRRAPRGDAPIPAEQRTTSWAAQIAQKRDAAGVTAEKTTAEAAPDDIDQALGVLISRSGSDLGSEYTVGGQPVSIGASARCAVRITDSDLASEEARIWVRGEHLMLHMFTRLSTVEAGGNAGSWQILEPGDTFPIGQHNFEFRLLPAGKPAHDAPASATAPNVLRDPEPEPRPLPQPGRFSDLMPRAD